MFPHSLSTSFVCNYVQAVTRLCGFFCGLFGQKLICPVAVDEVMPLESQSVDQSPGLVWATMRPILGEL